MAPNTDVKREAFLSEEEEGVGREPEDLYATRAHRLTADDAKGAWAARFLVRVCTVIRSTALRDCSCRGAAPQHSDGDTDF